MPYPPQPYPPLTQSGQSSRVDTHQVYTPSLGPVELEEAVPEAMMVDDEGNTPLEVTIVEESTKDDIPVQATSPPVIQDPSHITPHNSDCHLAYPGADQRAYVWTPASMGVTEAPLVLAENSSAFSAVSVLGLPTEGRDDGAAVHSELTTASGFDCNDTSSALGEFISQLLYTVAFSHLSRPRCVSPPITLNSAFPKIRAALSPGGDISASCADNSLTEQSNSSLFTNPVPATPPGFTSPLPPSSPGFFNDCSMDVSYGAPALSSVLSSSPAPSSSPPNFFTSSPTLNPQENSPLTSPVPIGKLAAAPRTIRTNPLKRPHSPDTAATSPGNQGDSGGEPVKKKKLNTCEPPQPKRSTHLSQHREHVKLKTPFRSPVTAATKDCPRYKDTGPSSEPDLPSSPAPVSQHGEVVRSNLQLKLEKDAMDRVRTPRASGQFKSPLSAATGSGMGHTKRVFSASPNVQALQSRVQTLKRAINIKNSGEGEKLEKLAKKWTDVAREVAWEVWSVVKDNVQDVSKLGSARGAFQDSWGWANEGKEDGESGRGRPSGEDEMLSEEDEPPVPEDTMSVMLRKMGIDPSTLGWDENEGEFMDVSC